MACYLCGSEQSTRRKGQVRDNPNSQIHECAACDLVYLSACEPENLTTFYQEGGMHGGAESAVPIDHWLRETARDDSRRFESFREQIVNKRVLDFGCGAGGFLLRAREVAESVAGVELEKRLTPHFKTNALSVFADIDHFPLERKFDVITAFHVIEHLPDPRNMLEKLKEHLGPNGKIIVEVPSSDDALLTLYENDPFSRFTYWSCHLFLFNAHTLSLLAKQAGLRVSYIKHVQRYPISNHLYWLSRGNPGGHDHWAFLDSPEMDAAYANTLARIGKTDTLIACLAH
ncbi:MAG: methyltransferase domain-containing protein [Actinobacteria bacterium]|nr:methyltransferase domain-containing protein [Actinomycetota bacterium]